MKPLSKTRLIARCLPSLTAFTIAVLSLPAAALNVEEFNSLYVGVDSTDTLTVSSSATPYDFVGLGVLSAEISGLTGVPGYTGSPPPNGTVNVETGSTLQLNYLPTTIGQPTVRPLDNSVLVGVSLNSTGTLNVNGGTVNTPILFAGQGDNARPSTGTVNITNGGTINATLDSGPTGPLPGFPAVGIGRGLGSVGTVNVDGAGSELNAAAGMISIGREGSGTLNITDGGKVIAGNTVFGSTTSATGSSSILVQGSGSELNVVGNNILLGIAIDLNPANPSHGTSTLNVRDSGNVVGNVVIGSGGTLKGDGTVTGNVTNFGGTILPGNSPGTLQITGDYTQNGGVIEIEIAGTSVFDLIDVTGSAILNDVLIKFIFVGGYAPQANDSFNFLKATSVTIQNPLSYQIAGLLPGFDYNVTNDGGVLLLTALTNGTAVPEPATLALLGLGLIGLAARRRRV